MGMSFDDLTQALIERDVDGVRAALAAGADVNARDHQGEPVWKLALGSVLGQEPGSPQAQQCLVLLAQNGLRLDRKTSKGLSLLYALEINPPAMALALLTATPSMCKRVECYVKKEGIADREFVDVDFWKEQLALAYAQKLDATTPPGKAATRRPRI